jgi:hypothetical protein
MIAKLQGYGGTRHTDRSRDHVPSGRAGLLGLRQATVRAIQMEAIYALFLEV